MARETVLKNLLAEKTMEASGELSVAEAASSLRCLACGHRCLIRPDREGICKVRFNLGGKLRVPAGYVAGLQIDPIEKKPFYHAFPGRNALSFGMLGCDLHCSYCQNWITSQVLRDEDAVAAPRLTSADNLVRLAIEHGSPVVVSTYNEPLITAEWSLKVFEGATAAGLVCGFVSNGNATPEVLKFLRPHVSLYKVDLKSFNDRNYRQLGCKLDTILRTIEELISMGFWVEIVTLVIPEFNDSDDELRDIARFIAGVSRDIPWHVTAFHPDYKMTDPSPTPIATLLKAYDYGKEAGLNFVYPGNLHGAVGERENTRCPSCGDLLIERRGFQVLKNSMEGDDCPNCKAKVPGVWEASPPTRSEGSGRPIPLSL